MVAALPQLWPPPTDFSLMLQNPKMAFKDPDLMTCTIARDSNNQPKACSGAFAVVYKGTYQSAPSRSGDVAIRVFTSASSERQDRYKAISEYLKQCPLKCLVDFEYLDKGIRHPSGKWYPLVRMEWVKGDILYNYTRDCCQAGDKQALGKLADKWVELVTELARGKIAHGDLQHANVMVTDKNELKLVDYDCMYVPTMGDQRRNLELGVVPYQNPSRTEETLLFSGIDNFSALFIFVVLRALAAEPRLWATHVAPPGVEAYEKMLFRATDFEDARSSALYRDLMNSTDPKVPELTKKLFELWTTDLKEIPALTELVNDFDKIRGLFKKKMFDEALDLVQKSMSSSPPPKDIQAEVDLAKQRVKCREELEGAIQAGDESAIKRAYRPQLLDDYPKAQPAVEIARKADQAIAALNDLQTAKTRRDWRGFVQSWDKSSALLTPRKSAAGLSIEARKWAKSNEACDEVWRAYRQRPFDFEDLSTAWAQLKQLGGHPETDAEKSQIEALLRKHEMLSEFTRLEGGVGEQIDTSRCRAWREDDFRGWDEAERYRPEYEASQVRLQIYQELRDLAQKWPVATSINSENAIVEQALKLPPNYECDQLIRRRVVEAKRRLMAFKALQQAASQNPLLDSALGQAWQELDKLKGRDLVPAKQQPRLDLAVRRMPVLANVTAISLNQPLDQLDQAILRAWDPELLSDDDSKPELRCRESAQWQAAYLNATRRVRLLQELEQSLVGGDVTRVQELSNDPLLAGYPVPSHLRIDNSSSLGEVLSLLAAVRKGDRELFRQKFDASLIRRFQKEFLLVSNELHELIVSEILPCQKNGTKRVIGSEPIDERAPGVMIFDIQWGWPQPRFLDRVIVGVCRGNPPVEPSPEKLVTRFSTDRQTLKHGSGRFVLVAKREWLNALVVVWGVIDLGFREYFTESFTVGRLSSRGGK